MPKIPSPPSPGLHPFDGLVELMRILRSEDGCPWDRAQDLQSLKPYAVEECYEVLDAIDSGDPDRHRDELGDLLLQIVFQAQLRWEEEAFDAHDVCRTITAKMLRRHPHVFEQRGPDNPEEAHRSWEKIKAAERAGQPSPPSALSGVPPALPALLRAQRLSEKAAGQGFDWTSPQAVLPKIREEVLELSEALVDEGPGSSRAQEELGDLLFVLVNLARKLDLDAEEALRGTNNRFAARFQHMEQAARERGSSLAAIPSEELETLWDAAKQALSGGESP
ncbi:MAG: nucleoside triphosphate pyrophosphohydrolase [Myxococcota bacterium]|nr:nucleoside triphosphate pyrophosphohydrolase [Myxococcota bacterium]